MKDQKQLFAIIGLIALIGAAAVIGFMASQTVEERTDVPKIIADAKKGVPEGLGEVPPELASGDTIMMGGPPPAGSASGGAANKAPIKKGNARPQRR
jgi:hypothetical protein